MVSDMCPTDASVAGLETNTLRIDEPDGRILVFICLMRSPAKLELVRPIFCLKKCALEEARHPVFRHGARSRELGTARRKGHFCSLPQPRTRTGKNSA